MPVSLVPTSVTGPFNLGNPDELSILELAETILDLIGNKSEIVFKKLPNDDRVF